MLTGSMNDSDDQILLSAIQNDVAKAKRLLEKKQELVCSTEIYSLIRHAYDTTRIRHDEHTTRHAYDINVSHKSTVGPLVM